MDSNCYLVIDEKSREVLIIDPGDDADYIQRIISDEELKPVMIIATHGHFDHILAVTELKLTYNIRFLMSRDDEFLLSRVRSSAEYFTKANDVLPKPTIDSYLTGATPVSVGKMQFEVIKTPGHTPGSVSLYFKKENALFVGDLIFKSGGIGRYDFEYCSKDDLIKSIRNIIKLPENTIVYPGHGDPTTIGDEKSSLLKIISEIGCDVYGTVTSNR